VEVVAIAPAPQNAAVPFNAAGPILAGRESLAMCWRKRNPPKKSCTERLINAKVARVVSGSADKDESVYR
jgi:hypothetical protein